MMFLLLLFLRLSTAFAAEAHLTASVQPVDSHTVALGATRVPFLQIALSAGCSLQEPVTIDTLTLRHQGLGSRSDLRGIYVMSGALRLSRLQQVNARDGLVLLRTRSLTIAPCAQRTILIAADIAFDATGSAEHRLVLQGVGAQANGRALQASIEAGIQIPVTRLAPVDVDGPVFEERSLLRRITYGGQRVVARFLLTAGADAIDIQAITFRNAGRARNADLQNLSIETTSGTRLTKIVPALDGDIVRFTFDPPFRMDRSLQRMLEVRADTRASIKKTIDLELEEASDIEWTAVQR